MKKLTLATITIYQTVLSPVLKQLLGTSSFCRFRPSCSQYTKQSIQKYGIIKGLKAGITRLAHCQPWTQTYGTTI